MRKWTRSTVKLKKNHEWKAKPGNKVFVADRGAVRFDFPANWIVTPGPDSIRFNDKEPPDDNVLLQVSVLHLNPDIDWSELSLTEMLQETVLKKDERGFTEVGEVHEVKRPDLELVWAEAHFIDPNENREARSRACFARGSNIQPFITIDFWPEDAGWVDPIWDEVLRTLRLGDYIADPSTGQVRRIRRG